MNQKAALDVKVKSLPTWVGQSPFYTKASLMVREFQGWLDEFGAANPVKALLCMVAVVWLSAMAVHGLNETVQGLMMSAQQAKPPPSPAATPYGQDSAMMAELFAQMATRANTYNPYNQYLQPTPSQLVANGVELGLLFVALFMFARVPFCLGVLLALGYGVFSGKFHYPAALLPFGVEFAFLASVAVFQANTFKAWFVTWRRRKRAVGVVLGFAVYVLAVYWVAAFASAFHGSWAGYLVWAVGVVVFFVWMRKKKTAENRLFDATLEPEKYFKNEGVVLGWCYCNIPERIPDTEDEFMPYQKAAQVVRYTTDKHFLSIMPNRSGKGRSQIIPNLLQLADWSCWVVDPKGENALVTAQWRQAQGHEIVIFNPYGLWADEFKARGFDTFQTFNPLLNLDPASDRFIGDVDMLADALVYNTGGDSHWSEGARGLVALLIMYLVTEPTEKATFRRLRELLAGGYDSLTGAFGLMSESPCDLVRENVGRFAHVSKETESIIATAETQTNIFRNKTLCNALDGGAFDFEAMKNRKMTVYMILPAEYLVTQARFLRLILLSAMAQFTRSEEGKHRIMVLLDEFANLGPLQVVEQGAALISGYGVTLWPFVQNLSQLQKLYPNNWEVFVANAAAITVANVNDVTTAEYFSKRAGKTVKRLFSGSSASGGSGSSSTRGWTESVQDILPVEDMYNQWGTSAYVFFEGKAPPLIVQKSNYDAGRLPWSDRAANNPMVKVWR